MENLGCAKLTAQLLLAVLCVCGLPVRSVSELVYGGGSAGWSEWDTVVDGVMGGLSSGAMDLDGEAVRFSGDINFDGGGFSSISRQLAQPANLTDISGFLVTLDALPVGSSPMALDLSLNTVGSFWTHGATLTARPGPAGTKTQHFLPMDTFTRTSWNGRRCLSSCQLDPTAVNRIGLFVLFQEGPFELTIHSIEAVASSENAPTTQTPVLNFTSNAAVADFLTEAAYRGAVLYDKGYPELGVALHAVALETVLSANGPPRSIRPTICAGLAHVAAQDASSQEMAWLLLRLVEAVVDDLTGDTRQIVTTYPEVARGAWLMTINNSTTDCVADAVARDVATLVTGTEPALVPERGTSSQFAVVEEVGPGMVGATEPAGGGAVTEASSNTSAATGTTAGGAAGRALLLWLATALMATFVRVAPQ
mmetsp:Transcript_7866/g.14113  ORF Transcript_7866/g.14113 Transcript_7866/m.14113 type:complete len:422 (-) Transcript_7866:348-1613(-)